jgi:RNA polymerase sigma-70 factor (ECF subfamily)
MEDSDAAAIALALAGDGDGFRILVERYSRGVFRLAYRMTSNEFDAEDVVQETFLRAHRQLTQYESRSSFSTWLYRIAANYSLDLVRARKRHAETAIDETPANQGAPDDAIHALPASSPGPDRLLFSDQVQKCVASTLDELSQQERTAFVLRHFEGQSIEEISAALGLSANAAKHSIFRAVQKLRRALEPMVSHAL